MLKGWQGGFASIVAVLATAGLLVLLERSRVIAAQAARSSQQMSAALDGSGDRSTAYDEARTYMIMLLMAAPVPHILSAEELTAVGEAASAAPAREDASGGPGS